MSRLQYNILFTIMVAGALFLLVSKQFGIEVDPSAFTGYGAITTYVLTQRNQWTKTEEPKKPGEGGGT